MKQDTFTRPMILSGILFILLGIALGAVAAHSLASAGVPEDKIASFETGIKLQMYIGIGILLLVGIREHFQFSLKVPVYLLWIGVLFFSGSIYFLATKTLHGIEYGKFFPLITPLGGVLMIAGWAIIFVKYLTQKK